MEHVKTVGDSLIAVASALETITGTQKSFMKALEAVRDKLLEQDQKIKNLEEAIRARGV